MSVGLVTRSSSIVEHFGVWAYDRTSIEGRSWDTGRWVPMCGQERNHGDSWRFVANARTDLSLMPSLKRRRLCLRCLDLLADLNTLTEGEPDA